MNTPILSGEGVCQRAHDDGRMLLQSLSRAAKEALTSETST
ncbi:hypothetical protein SASC598J21_000270, partial [Snodgrassella alvi SCGC AB-598-J21]